MNLFQKILCASTLCLLSMHTFADSINRIVAVVNDDVITSVELNEQVKQQQTQLKQQRIQEPAMNVLQKHVLKRMIDVELQMQLAKSNGLEITDQQLNEAINRIAANNKVSVKVLKQKVESMGETWAKYRKGIRKEMLLGELQQKSVGQVAVTDEQVNDYIKANKNQAKLQYHVEDLLLSLPEAPSSELLALKMKQANELMTKLNHGLAFKSADVELPSGKVTVKSADLGVRSLASLPQMFAERIISMKPGEISGPVRAANGLHMIKLTDIQGELAPKMATVYHVKHILLKTAQGTDGTKQKTALLNIAKQIKAGKSFENLAKQYSQDTPSAKQGGDLGWLHDGETVPEFEKTFKTLKAGQLSQPVKSAFGWHLIKLIGTKKIDDSAAVQKQQVRQALYQRKFNQAVEDWLVHIKSSAYIKTYL